MKKIVEYFKREWMFYATGFFSGMSVMAVELGAQRMLSPYFSSTQIIWTIVIGVIMISMAVGNIIGGKMADKMKKADWLFILIAAAGCWLLLVPVLGKIVISLVAVSLATFVTWNYLLFASLLSCILVFVPPLLVLGMVTPNIVKFATKDLNDNGKVVGKIEAFNTIGSIIGTFLPTFVTIPFIGTSLTFVIFGALLLVIALIYFIFRKKFVVKISIIFVIFLSIGIASSFIKTAFWDSSVIYEGESEYNYLRVVEDESSIYLSTHVLFGVQSYVQKDGKLVEDYASYALAAPIMDNILAGEKKDILILGLATGTYANLCYKYFGEDKVNIDGVEIDGKIVDLAYKYFNMNEKVNAIVDDARAYLNVSKKKYDIIFVDAYRDITIPYQMSTLEFFTSVKDHLNEDGIMIVNFCLTGTKEGNLNDRVIGTIGKVFPNIYSADASGNLILYVGNRDLKQSLENHIDEITANDLRILCLRIANKMQEVEPKDYILTDDLAPVEMLGMQLLDEQIEAELQDLKSTIKGKSFKELLEMLLSGNF